MEFPADYADYGDLRRMGFGFGLHFRGNIFIKTLNKNLRSSARSALSAGDYFLKKRISLFFILFISQTLFSLDFFIAPYTGVMFGKLGEYLYEPHNDDYIVSELIWEQKPIYLLGFDLGFYGYKSTLTLTNEFGLPTSIGHMFDKDFSRDLCYNYTINENNSRFYYKTTLMYINDIYTNNTFTISPTFSLSFTYNEMYSQNGYGWYGDTINTKLSDKVSYDNPNAIFYDIGKISGVDLSILNFSTFLGISFSYNINLFKFSIKTMISPFSFLNYTDIHRDDFSYKRGYSKERITYSEFYSTFGELYTHFESKIYFNSKFSFNILIAYKKIYTDKDKTYLKGYYDEINNFNEFIKIGQKSKITADFVFVTFSTEIKI